MAPSDKTIEATLRRVARQASKANDEITVNTARTRAESELDLEPGFLKSRDNGWKEKSKEIIESAFDSPPSSSVASPLRSPPKRSSPDSPTAEDTPPAKRRKTVPTSDDKQESGDNIDVSPRRSKNAAKPKPAPKKKAAEPVRDDPSDYSDVIDEAPPPKKKRGKNSTSPTATSQSKTAASSKAKPPATEAVEDDPSDYSDVIDEPLPQKRGKKSKSPSVGDKSKKPKPTSKSSKGTSSETSPDEEEIKRLKGQLAQCGVRRVWGPILAKLDTNKARITHLKAQLSEVGMTGRFSQKQAEQIRAANELKQELADAQEFNQQWGNEADGDEGQGGSDDEERGNTRGKKRSDSASDEVKPQQRRLPKGFVDFGDSGDEGSD